MDRLIGFAARHPLPLVLIIGLLTAAATPRLPDLRSELSTEAMMIKKDPARDFYRHMLDTFGSENVTIVFLADPDLFHPEKLRAVRTAVEAIEALPFVDRTESLFSLSHLRSVEGYVTADPYLKAISASAQEAAAIKAAALRNPFVAANLLSDSGIALAVNIYLRADDGQPDFDARVSQGIDRALAPLRGKLETAFQIGSPYVRTEILEKIHSDQRRVLPLAILVLFATLALSLRLLGGVVIPFLTAGLSVVWTLGLMAAVGTPLTVMTAIVPVQDARNRHAGRALQHVLANRRSVILLAGTTTLACGYGALSLRVSNAPLSCFRPCGSSHFGICCRCPSANG
jgi:hypothetical protein